MGYRNSEEMNYFGSDLNKFTNEFCSKEMTAINIDFLGYKRSKKIVRIIESKHSREKTPTSQREVLEIFASVFKKLNKRIVIFDYTFECYIHRGDYPYNISQVEDLVNDTKFLLDNENLKKFLEFEDYEIHSSN
ncbi:hypothetical protein CMI37_34540 [Candidatus Pacearchaeota archaeon]|nr:hypothetical protein [Candidatus Pacearchaeota archaeon]